MLIDPLARALGIIAPIVPERPLNDSEILKVVIPLNAYKPGDKGHLGYKHSEETKQLFSEQRQGVEPWNKGIELSEEHRKNLSASHLGQRSSPATEFKPGVRNGGTDGMTWRQDTVKCPHCSKTGGLGLMRRYHFDNCKVKT